MVFLSTGWSLTGSGRRHFFSLSNPPTKCRYWGFFVSYILARAKKLPSPLLLDFCCVITCFILMERPSPWVRSRENVFFSLFQYMSFTLSSYFGCFLRPVCGEDAQYCYLKRRCYPLHWTFFHPCGSENIHFSIISHLVCWFPLQKHNFTVFPFSNWFVNNRFISLGAIYPVLHTQIFINMHIYI